MARLVVCLVFASLLPACVMSRPIGGGPQEPTGQDPSRGSNRWSQSEAREAAATEANEWRVIGQSRQGRPLRRMDIGRGRRRVLWIGGIHGNETEGVVATEELPTLLRRTRGILDEVTLTILEDVNPDGRANGTRYNSVGIDLNRNYPARNFKPGRFFGQKPLSEPEAQAVAALIEEIQPDLVMVAHSWGSNPSDVREFINFDGPARRYAEVFSALAGPKYEIEESTNIHGTPGSLGSWVGIDQQIPILTIEYARGSDPRQCWEETRPAILACIEGVD